MKNLVYVEVFLMSFLFQILWVGSAWGQYYNYSLGNRDVLKNEARVPIYPWFPDGHISVLPETDGGKNIMYWSGHENYRTSGDFPFPEVQYTLSPEKSIFGGRRGIERWDNGGSWLMSVFRQEGDGLVGFYHAEDHWVRATNPQGIAWKSLARTTSLDNGITWSEGELIITSATPKPENPTWGGAGDNCVVWDHINNRWLCYYQEHWLMMAVSYDVEGKPGTWLKYNNGEFSQPGLGGESTPIPGISSKPGGNPSVHYNSYLEKFVMVWHSWVSTSIYISTSSDGVVWEEPRLLQANSGPRRAWYPTIIGESDTKAGKIARLYYADIASGFSSRDFVSKALVFDLEDEYHPQFDWQHQRIGQVPVLGLMDMTNEEKLRIVAFNGSIENTENIEYYYKNKEGSYLVSGKFYLDELYDKGAIGLSVRAGLAEGDVMAAILFSKGELSFRAREQSGDLALSPDNSMEWLSDTVWLQIEKLSDSAICRYSSEGKDWTDLGSIPFNYTISKAGLFSTGSTDIGTIAYVEQFKESGLVTSIQDNFMDGKISSFSNPSGNQVFITHPEYFNKFSIYDLNGRLHLSGTIDSNYIDVQKLKPGLYVLSLLSHKTNRSITGKLVIAR